MENSAPPANCELNNYKNKSKKETYQLFDNNKNQIHNFLFDNDENNFNNKSKNMKNEFIKKDNTIRISIDTEKMKALPHKNLIELIQFIEFTCDLTLNDCRYVDNTYNIFKIIKNKEKGGYDIIIQDFNEEKQSKKGDEDKKLYGEDEVEEQEDKVDYDYDEDDSYKKNENNHIEEENIINSGFKIEESQNYLYKNNDKNFTINNQINQISNDQNANKILDFNYSYNNINQKTKILNGIYSNNNNNIFYNSPKMIFINNNNSIIKCTDCDLIFNSIEAMNKHHFEIHNKNKKTEIKKSDINYYTNMKDYYYKEEEAINRKYRSDLQRLLRKKGFKIGFKMREISTKKADIIQNILKIDNKEKLLEELEKPEAKKIIKDLRQKELKKINEETSVMIKKLKMEKYRKLNEIKQRRKEDEEEKRRIVEVLKRKEEKKRFDDEQIKQEELNRKN